MAADEGELYASPVRGAKKALRRVSNCVKKALKLFAKFVDVGSPRSGDGGPKNRP